MGLIQCLKDAKLFQARDIKKYQEEVDKLVSDGYGVVEAEAIVKHSIVSSLSTSLGEELNVFIKEINTDVKAAKIKPVTMEKQDAPNVSKEEKKEVKSEVPESKVGIFERNLATIEPITHNVITPDVAVEVEVEETPQEKLPLLEVAGLRVGDTINSVDTIESFNSALDTITVTTRNKKTGEIKTRPLRELKQTRIKVSEERNFSDNPLKVGETVTFKNKEYTVKLNRNGNIAIEDEDGNLEFPELKEITAAKKENNSLSISNDRESAVKRVALRMSSIFPTVQMVMDYFPWEQQARFHGGVVQINLRTADIEAPVHEFLHPFVFVLSKENPELYSKFLKEIQQMPEYKSIKAEVEADPSYLTSNRSEKEEEILVRIATKLVMTTVNDDGSFNEEKAQEIMKKSGAGSVIEFLTSLLDILKDFFRGIVSGDRGSFIRNVTSVEYNPSSGNIRVFKKGREKALFSSFVGKFGEKLSFEDFSNSVDKSFHGTELEENKIAFIRDIKSVVSDILPDEEGIVSFMPKSVGNAAVRYNKMYRQKTSSSDFVVDLRTIFANEIALFPKDTSLQTIADIIASTQSHSFNLSKHDEAFKKLADRFYSKLRSKEDLKLFIAKYRKSLVNMRHMLEERLKSTEATTEMKDTIIENLSIIKPLLEEGYITDTNFLGASTDIIRHGFLALAEANKLMVKIKTRVNYGNIGKYVENLKKELSLKNIQVVLNKDLFYGIRIHGSKVEINPEKIVRDGLIYTDITRFITGKTNASKEFITALQEANSKAIRELESKLTEKEIEEINWDIMALRSFYATFKVFGKTILDEYSSHLESLDEYKYFSNALSASKDRMDDLERSMRTLAVEWLYPYFEKLQQQTLSLVSKEEKDKKFIDKESFAKLFRYAEKDSSAVDHLFGTLVNSHDPLNATIGILISDIIDRNTSILGHVVQNTIRLKDSYFVKRGVTSSAGRAKYIKENFLRKAKIKEIKRDNYGNIITDDGNRPVYELKDRWVFHTEYLTDEFDIATEEFISTLNKPVPPHGGELTEWSSYKVEVSEYNNKIKKWREDNKDRFLNPAWKALTTDEMFVFFTTTYNNANAFYGEQGLKNGLIPQAYKHESYFSKKDSLINKIKGWIGRVKEGKTTTTEKIKGSLKAATKFVVDEEQKLMYEQENPDGTIYRSIKNYYLKPIPEEDLNFDLTETIAGFAEDAMRYGSLRDIQANMENTRALIMGGIGSGRGAKKVDVNGDTLWYSVSGKPKSKSLVETRLNKQLNDFIDDVFYGQSEKESRISLWKSKKYKEKYAEALKMIKEQKTPKEIFKETSFYIGEDGRWHSDEYSNVSISLNKLSKNLAFYTSASSLAFNLMSTTRNITIGNFVNFSEAHGGRYYSKVNYLKAQKIYAALLPDNIRGMVTGERNKLNQILHDYQAIQGEFRDRYNKMTTDKSVISRLFSKDSIFFLQHVAEHQIQGTATLALMLNTAVKKTNGEETNLWDAYELDERGTLRLNKDIDLNSFDETKFIRDLHEMNRSNHGNFSQLHKATIQREWYGKLLMTFKKHIYPTLKARFGSKKADYSKGFITEGFHRVFLRKLGEDISTYGLNILNYESISKGGKATWSEDEKYAFRRSTFETMWGVIGMLVLVLLLDSGDDDDDDSVTKKWVLATANGLYSDIAITNPLGIFNPFVMQSEVIQESKKLLTNPVASQYVFKKMGDFLSELGKEEGEPLEKAAKLIPIINHIDAITNPEDYIDNYIKYQSLVGAGSK